MDTNPAPTPEAPKPVISRSRAVWLGERKFESGPEGRTHLIDAGAKEAPGPVETLLSAIATCSSVDVLEILAKRRTPVERMTVNITGHRRTEAPRRLIRVELEYRIDGNGIEGDQAERAIQLAFEKFCSVAASLAPDIEAQSTLVLNGEARPPQRREMWRLEGARS
jgi:putative redox protein